MVAVEDCGGAGPNQPHGARLTGVWAVVCVAGRTSFARAKVARAGLHRAADAQLGRIAVLEQAALRETPSKGVGKAAKDWCELLRTLGCVVVPERE